MGGCLSVSLCDNNNNNNIIIPSEEEEEEGTIHNQNKNQKKKKKKIRAATAKVISVSGALHEFALPASVSHVLLSLQPQTLQSPSSQQDPGRYFLCDSDLLSYDDFIPPLNSDAHLLPNHLYFLLPSSKLLSRLSPSDMAALAVKASLALQSSDTSSNYNNKKKKDDKHRSRKARNRISPVSLLNNHHSTYDNNPSSIVDSQQQHFSYTINNNNNNNLVSSQQQHYDNNIRMNNLSNYDKLGEGGLPRSASVHRLQKYASRRAKLAVRSFRLRLATIYEGATLFT